VSCVVFQFTKACRLLRKSCLPLQACESEMVCFDSSLRRQPQAIFFFFPFDITSSKYYHKCYLGVRNKIIGLIKKMHTHQRSPCGLQLPIFCCCFPLQPKQQPTAQSQPTTTATRSGSHKNQSTAPRLFLAKSCRNDWFATQTIYYAWM
jgi:hypothetical protein